MVVLQLLFYIPQILALKYFLNPFTPLYPFTSPLLPFVSLNWSHHIYSHSSQVDLIKMQIWLKCSHLKTFSLPPMVVFKPSCKFFDTSLMTPPLNLGGLVTTSNNIYGRSNALCFKGQVLKGHWPFSWEHSFLSLEQPYKLTMLEKTLVVTLADSLT